MSALGWLEMLKGKYNNYDQFSCNFDIRKNYIEDCWTCKFIDAAQIGKGNTPLQALENCVANLKVWFKEQDEDVTRDNAMREFITSELFGNSQEMVDNGAIYLSSRSPTDLVTDVLAVVKKVIPAKQKIRPELLGHAPCNCTMNRNAIAWAMHASTCPVYMYGVCKEADRIHQQ